MRKLFVYYICWLDVKQNKNDITGGIAFTAFSYILVFPVSKIFGTKFINLQRLYNSFLHDMFSFQFIFYPKSRHFLSSITLLFDKTRNSNLIRNQGLRDTKRRPRLSLERYKPSLIFQVSVLYTSKTKLFFWIG
jgi:hypothetical protein